jgi:hypothetical protein
MTERTPATLADRAVSMLLSVIADIPKSREEIARTPADRARQLTIAASSKAAGVAGTLALPPGPVGLLTILPDLAGIWRIQAHLVADIAAAFGKTGRLDQQAMLYCLFRHAAAHALKDLGVQVGSRVIVRPVSLRLIQRVLKLVGVELTQRMLGRLISRTVPVIGAFAVAGYAYFDTRQVGKVAADLFSREFLDDGE